MHNCTGRPLTPEPWPGDLLDLPFFLVFYPPPTPSISPLLEHHVSIPGQLFLHPVQVQRNLERVSKSTSAPHPLELEQAEEVGKPWSQSLSLAL